MARKCAVCVHPDIQAIHRAKVEGKTIAVIAREFGISEDSVTRHWEKHVAPMVREQLQKAIRRAQVAPLVNRLQRQQRRTEMVLANLAPLDDDEDLTIDPATQQPRKFDPDTFDSAAFVSVQGSLKDLYHLEAELSGQVGKGAGNTGLDQASIVVLVPPQRSKGDQPEAFIHHAQARIATQQHYIEGETESRQSQPVDTANQGPIIDITPTVD